MKTRFIILICLFTSSIQLLAQNIPNQVNSNFYYHFDTIIHDSLIQGSLSFPESNTLPLDPYVLDEGIMPEEVLFVQELNKYFIYGNHALIVVDASTNGVEEQVHIANRGDYALDWGTTGLGLKNNQRIAYDPDNQFVWCLSNDGELLTIDATDYSTVNEIELFESTHLFWAKIIHDQRTSSIFLMYNIGDETEYRHYDDSPPFNLIENKDFSGQYSDFDVHKSADHVYMAVGDSVEKRSMYQIETITETYYLEAEVGHIAQFYFPGSNYHKTFIFPKDPDFSSSITFAHSINENSGQVITFNVETGYITSSSFNPDQMKVYYCYNKNFPKGPFCRIIDANSLAYIDDIVLPHDENAATLYEYVYSSEYTSFGKLYLGTTSNLVGIDGISNAIFSTSNYNRHTLVDIEENSLTNQLCVLDLFIGSAEIFSASGNLLNSVPLGGQIFQGCYNDNENTVYCYDGDLISRDKCLHYYKVNGGISGRILFENWSGPDYQGFISDVLYDENRNVLYVAAYDDTRSIKIIDCSTNTIAPDTFLFNPKYTTGIFIANDKLYCVGGAPYQAMLFIYNLETTGPIQVHYLGPYTDNLLAYFDVTAEGNVLISLSDEGGTGWGKILLIDGQNDDILEDLGIVYQPEDIIYSPVSNKAFVINYARMMLHCLDLNQSPPGVFPVHYQPQGIFDVDYLELNNRVVTAGLEVFNTILYYIDCESYFKSEGLIIGSGVSSIHYNEKNNKLYASIPWETGGANQMKLLEIDIFDDQITETEFEIYNLRRKPNLGLPHKYNDIIFDNNNDYLYLPSGFHSRLQVVPLPPEQLSLRPNITWLSFPKLEREGNDPVDAVQVLTGRITPDDFNYGKMSHNEVIPNPAGPPHSQSMTSIEKPDHQHPWNPEPGDLELVTSTKGYILEIDPGSPGTIDLYGSRLDPSTSFPLYTGVDNWTGYFLTYPQDVFDAFEPILDYVYSVKTQDWAIVRQHPPGGGGGGPDDFLQPSHPLILEYGDLAIVEVMQDIPEFTWNNLAPANQGSEVPMAETFSYEELSAYTPIYMQLDTTENPAEIGAFVNDSCVGACVVSTDDTLAALKAYTGELTGEITFQQYYGPTKSSNRKIDSYLVYEPGLDAMVNRTIHTGEGKDFYLVSLKTGNSPVAGYSNGISLLVLPNPCTGQCGLRYAITSTCDVAIEVFNATGIRLNSFTYGQQPAGQYDFSIPGPCKPGVYIIKLSACGSSKVKKLVITR